MNKQTGPIKFNMGRILPALLMSAIVIIGAIAGGLFWLTLVCVGFIIAFKELMTLMLHKGLNPSKVVVLIVSVLCYFLAFWGHERHFQIIITAGVLFTVIWMICRKDRPGIADIGATILMFFYLGYLPAHFILLRQIEMQNLGLYYLFFTLFAVSFSDIGAYYGGKLFGKTLLSPGISPKKTVEGFISGWITGLSVALLFGLCVHLPILHLLILGSILPFVGLLGDLFESLLKRDAGLKDMGTLIPGHGGLLDRTDSYIFAGVVTYYYVIWFVLKTGLIKEIMQNFHY